MQLLGFLILFPLVIAFLVLLAKNEKVRGPIIKVSSVLISAAAIAFLVTNFHKGIQYFDVRHSYIDKILFAVEVFLAGYVFVASIKYRQWRTTVLIVAQTAIAVSFRIIYGSSIQVSHNIFVDKLSIIMVMIVAILASLICVYSIGYMKDYQRIHKEVKDNRSFFFFVIYVFMSAMFTLVLTNNLTWIFFCWEITTLSSFFLIGYAKKTSREAKINCFRALEYNLWGGIAIISGVFYLYYSAGTVELDKLMNMGKAAAMIPVALICFGGITKAAQYPFCKWLLGAMVAPTPVSALLHSSTMVKAGVYIVLRFALVLEGTMTGYLVASVGGLTFLIGSIIAIAQDDAKKVLAYSTVANLGLIILCAGVGTYEAMWAGIFLIIFHAVTKCLLFLCVGVVDEKMHTRNIEDMCGLIISMPKVSIMMQIGIAGMFLAPFGMLISKWAVIKALVDSSPLLLLFVAFGGAATLFFWVKWMGKLTLVERPEKDVEVEVSYNRWIPLYILTLMTIFLVATLPFVSNWMVEPYIVEIYGRSAPMDHNNIMIMSIMLAIVMLFPLAFLHRSKRVRIVPPYLAGINTGDGKKFIGAFGKTKCMEMRDYYLDKYFGEGNLYKVGVVLSLIMIAGIFVSSVFI